MAQVSVAEAARLLGVGVPRVHQRIADGSLRAQRIGSQWVVDELSLLRVAERTTPGRPLSTRSAWAIIALADGDETVLAALAPAERARARARLADLYALADDDTNSEHHVRKVAATLRTRLRNRASRKLHQAASADLPALRQDPRWIPAGLSMAASGIGADDIAEGYVASCDLKPLSDTFLLTPAAQDANVIIHLVPERQRVNPESRLLLAADLSEHRRPREELRAAELLREAAEHREGDQR